MLIIADVSARIVHPQPKWFLLQRCATRVGATNLEEVSNLSIFSSLDFYLSLSTYFYKLLGFHIHSFLFSPILIIIVIILIFPPRWLPLTSSPGSPTSPQPTRTAMSASPKVKSQSNIITTSLNSQTNMSSLPHCKFTIKHHHRLPQNKSLSNIVAISPMVKSQ